MALGYTGENSSAISTPVSAGGGIGTQTFNLGNLGIGSSGTLGNVSGAQVPKWMWYAAISAIAGYLLIKLVKR